MTVIRPNSISGITSITAQANEINVFRSNGLIAGLNLNGVNFNTTSGISTLAALKVTGNVDVAGVLTYQDVTNVDSLGIGTFRVGVNVPAGQLDVGSNIKLGNAGVVTATSFVGSGANLTGIDTDLVSDTSPQLGGDLASNSHDILFADNDKAIFGTGSDLKIYHNGSHNYFLNSNGDYVFDTGSAELARLTSNGKMGIGDNSPDRELVVKNASSNATVKIEASNSHTSQLFFSDTDAEGVARIGVFHGSGQSTSNAMLFETGGSERLRITSAGLVSIPISGSLQVGAAGSGETDTKVYVANTGGNAYIQLKGADSSGTVGLKFGRNSVANRAGIDWSASTDALSFRTGGTGERLRITSAGNVEPATDNTYNFGSLTKRWANLYTADLNLSNEGSKNDVDGTWGQYTIQEGEDDLYLINKRSGKKYKFLLQEVS